MLIKERDILIITLIKKPYGDHGFEVEIPRHGNGLDKLEDPDKEVRQRRAKSHMDHGEQNRVRQIVHLAIQDELVVHNHTEGQEDPDGYIQVGHANLLDNTLANLSFAHLGRWLSDDLGN